MVFRCQGDGPVYLVVLDSYNNWGFPKGHVDGDESGSQAARREILEETALDDVVLHAPLGTIDWHFRARGRLIHKFCHFYLFESPSGEAVPQPAEGIRACAWHPLERARAVITYDNARDILDCAASISAKLCAGRGGHVEHP